MCSTGARREGAALIVGLNSDASVRRLKGPTRPVRSTAERAHVLAGLEAVDAVVVFDEDTPLELVRALAPDVIVKGGDYRARHHRRRRRRCGTRRPRGGDPADGRSIHDIHHRETPWLTPVECRRCARPARA